MKVDISKLDRAFNPKSLAIVGDSGELRWIRAHRNFSGKLFSVQVNPKTAEAIEQLGVKNYSTLLDIPGPIDLVIVAVNRKIAYTVLDDCIQKNAAGAYFYTSGYSETHTKEGVEFEQLLKEKAEKAKFHLIGPNCMGIFNPKLGLKQFEGQYDGVSGPIGFISQSGTHAMNFVLDTRLQGLNLGKSVSFGNGAVLDAAEYLEYFGRDKEIKVIGMYLEGVRNGKRFLEVLKKASGKKPVVIWKGGRTKGGERAVASHTGSMAIPQTVWDAVTHQHGAVNVDGMEELIDALKALLFLSPVRGDRVAITGGSGGQSVAITDAVMEAGLEVPELTQRSYDELASFFSLIGGGYVNPIDTGNSNREQLTRIMDIIEQDEHIDNIVMLTGIATGGAGGIQGANETHSQNAVPGSAESIIALRQKTSKPVMAAISASFAPGGVRDARQLMKALQAGGVPAFISIKRAAAALKKAHDYYRFKNTST
ncbi:CoA-binding protein [Thermodesulfobacteriota bacterium]